MDNFKMKILNKKAHQVGVVLLIIALFAALFAFGLYTGNAKVGVSGAAVGLEKISGKVTNTPESNLQIWGTGNGFLFKKEDGSWSKEGYNSKKEAIEAQTKYYESKGLAPPFETLEPTDTDPKQVETERMKSLNSKLNPEVKKETKTTTTTTKAPAKKPIDKNYLLCKEDICVPSPLSTEEYKSVTSEGGKLIYGTVYELTKDHAEAAYNAQKKGYRIEYINLEKMDRDNVMRITIEIQKQKKEDKTGEQKAYVSERTITEVDKSGRQTYIFKTNFNEKDEKTSETNILYEYDKEGKISKTTKEDIKYKDGKQVSGTKIISDKDGKPEEVYTWDESNFVLDVNLLNTKITQFQSREFFYQLESTLTDFSGLGYYSTLFFEEEDLDEWRENIDKTFATLYLGTEYWTSDICAIDTDRGQNGIAYVDTKLGLASVAAHIEASRSQQLLSPPEEADPRGIITPKREFLYKITFNVKNGDWEDDPKALEVMRFNIVLRGDQEAPLYKNIIEVEKGDSFGATGRNSIVQFSDFFYNQVCIEFENTPASWRLDDDELCNTIIGPSGPSGIGTGQQIAQQQESGGGEINDI